MSAQDLFFSHFPAFRSLSRSPEYRRFAPGEFLCREEEDLKDLYLILSGEAKVFRNLSNGRTHLFQTYGAGEIVGDIEYFLHIPASCTVRVEKLLEVAIIRPSSLEETDSADSRICEAMARGLAKKLHRESYLSSRNVSFPLRVRLADLILNGGLSNYGEGGIEECADRLGTSQRHLRRTLEEFEKWGLILRARRSLQVVDQEGLMRLADELYSP